MENKIFSYNYKNTIYNYKLTLASKAELERIQRKSASSLKNVSEEQKKALSEYLKVQRKFQSISKDKKATEEQKMLAQEELDNAQANLIPFIDNVEETNSVESLSEIMFVILKNHKDYKGIMTRNLSDEIIEDMEETMGTEKTWEFMVGVRDMVFTQMEAMNKALSN